MHNRIVGEGMSFMRIAQSILLGVAAVLAPAVMAAEEAGHGHAAPAPSGPAWVQEKVKTCATCHGEGGVSTTPAFPIIAGQYQDYLERALKDYRDGARKNPIMGAQAQGLSNAQIQALAAYYAAQPSPLYTPAIVE